MGVQSTVVGLAFLGWGVSVERGPPDEETDTPHRALKIWVFDRVTRPSTRFHGPFIDFVYVSSYRIAGWSSCVVRVCSWYVPATTVGRPSASEDLLSRFWATTLRIATWFGSVNSITRPPSGITITHGMGIKM